MIKVFNYFKVLSYEIKMRFTLDSRGLGSCQWAAATGGAEYTGQ